MKTSSDENPEKKKRKHVMSERVQKKLAITMVVIMLALFALIFKIWLIQDQNSEEYNQKILSQQRYDSRDIPYRRGDIYDRNGLFLATSEKVYNLIIDPSQINSNPDNYVEPTVNLLYEVFGFDAADIRKLLIDKSESQYIRYAKQLSYDDKQLFEARKEEINEEYKRNGDSHRVYGIWFEDSYRRYYPNNSLACNVIGFSISDGSEGSGGIEQYYNDELIGVTGREYGYLNDDSNLERVIKQSVDGNSLVSTIDVNVQSIIEKYIGLWETQTGSKTAACIVMDPNTGEVLGMAGSHPYDLNNPRDISAYYTEEQMATMTDAEKADAMNSVWRNFCISDTYEPGSVSKIFTVSAALEEGTISGDEVYVCDGYEEIADRIIHCNNLAGHGPLTVTESLMQSCNDAMMHISSALGRERFVRFMNLVGFGSKTGIDLPGEADTSNLIHKASEMVPSDLATNAFGQNFNCTMIQMAAAYCSVINGGSYYEPHVVKQILNSQGAVVKDIEPKLVCQTVSRNTTKFINNALLRTVNEGTGGAAIIEGYEICGKTGTAEKYPRDKKNYLVSFAGYAPAEDPSILCYVVVDEPHVEEQAKAKYATEIFRNIMSELLPYMNIYRSGDYPDEKPSIYNAPVYDNIETETEVPETSASQENNTGDNTYTETETEAETTQAKVYETDEFVYREENPEEDNYELPGVPAGTEVITVPEAPTVEPVN